MCAHLRPQPAAAPAGRASGVVGRGAAQLKDDRGGVHVHDLPAGTRDRRPVNWSTKCLDRSLCKGLRSERQRGKEEAGEEEVGQEEAGEPAWPPALSVR